MNTKPVATVRDALVLSVNELSGARTLFVKNPSTDFTRNSKLSFDNLIYFLLQMGGGSLNSELTKVFSVSDKRPSASALVQQRRKLLPEALEYLFYLFNEKALPRTVSGYRLLGADGSDVNIAFDPFDEDTLIHQGRGYNQIHLNALYDLNARMYVYALIQGKHKNSERFALNEMLSHLEDPAHTIIIADRGYESYNVFAHFIESGALFLIRVKAPESNGILSSYALPEGEFDCTIRTTLTHKQTKKVRENPQEFTYVPNVDSFDYLDDNQRYYPITFRIVRFRLPNGETECVATNLDVEEFPPEKLCELYNRRWGIETSFRQLKYSIGLVDFHSRKREFIIQEVYARLIMYNFTQAVIHAIPVRSKKDTKHRYKIELAGAIPVCRDFIRNGTDKFMSSMISLLQRLVIPIRPGRSAPRHVMQQSFRDFTYRTA